MFSNLLPGACSVNAGPTPLCLLLIQKTTLVNTWCPVHTPRPFRELPSLKVLTLGQVNTRCFSQRKALVFQLPQGPDVPAPARPSHSTLHLKVLQVNTWCSGPRMALSEIFSKSLPLVQINLQENSSRIPLIGYHQKTPFG